MVQKMTGIMQSTFPVPLTLLLSYLQSVLYHRILLRICGCACNMKSYKHWGHMACPNPSSSHNLGRIRYTHRQSSCRLIGFVLPNPPPNVWLCLSCDVLLALRNHGRPKPLEQPQSWTYSLHASTNLSASSCCPVSRRASGSWVATDTGLPYAISSNFVTGHRMKIWPWVRFSRRGARRSVRRGAQGGSRGGWWVPKKVPNSSSNCSSCNVCLALASISRPVISIIWAGDILGTCTGTSDILPRYTGLASVASSSSVMAPCSCRYSLTLLTSILSSKSAQIDCRACRGISQGFIS